MRTGKGPEIARVAVLEDDLRRRIYAFIRRARRPVNREEVASDAGISWRLAAFHLEKLLDRGLLKAHFARPPGRSGPGAGRSAKYYEPSDIEVAISLPERRYDLAGRLLLEAIQAEGPGESARETALRVAGKHGSELGEEVRRTRGLRRRSGAERTLAVAESVLEDHGFEPYRDQPEVVALRNCPFHSLATIAPDLVCEMNRSFIDGMLRGMGNENVQAVLACKPGDCCVSLRAPGPHERDAIDPPRAAQRHRGPEAS